MPTAITNKRSKRSIINKCKHKSVGVSIIFLIQFFIFYSFFQCQFPPQKRMHELTIQMMLGSFTTQNILGRKLPKVTLVGNAIPPNKAFLGWHPSVSFPWNQSNAKLFNQCINLCVQHLNYECVVPYNIVNINHLASIILTVWLIEINVK